MGSRRVSIRTQRVDLVVLRLFEDCGGVLDACEVNLALMDEGHEAPR